jgi:hypothetical protein
MGSVRTNGSAGGELGCSSAEACATAGLSNSAASERGCAASVAAAARTARRLDTPTAPAAGLALACRRSGSEVVIDPDTSGKIHGVEIPVEKIKG